MYIYIYIYIYRDRQTICLLGFGGLLTCGSLKEVSTRFWLGFNWFCSGYTLLSFYYMFLYLFCLFFPSHDCWCCVYFVQTICFTGVWMAPYSLDAVTGDVVFVTSCVCKCVTICEHVWTCVNKCETVWKCLKNCKHLWTCVTNCEKL